MLKRYIPKLPAADAILLVVASVLATTVMIVQFALYPPPQYRDAKPAVASETPRTLPLPRGKLVTVQVVSAETIRREGGLLGGADYGYYELCRIVFVNEIGRRHATEVSEKHCAKLTSGMRIQLVRINSAVVNNPDYYTWTDIAFSQDPSTP